jgi:hypothetical protein
MPQESGGHAGPRLTFRAGLANSWLSSVVKSEVQTSILINNCGVINIVVGLLMSAVSRYLTTALTDREVLYFTQRDEFRDTSLLLQLPF